MVVVVGVVKLNIRGVVVVVAPKPKLKVGADDAGAAVVVGVVKAKVFPAKSPVPEAVVCV